MKKTPSQSMMLKNANRNNQLPPLKLQKKKSYDPTQTHQNGSSQLIQSELQFVYQISKNNIDNFFGNIEEMLSKLYMEVAQQTLNYMNKNNFLNLSGAKLHISHHILIANINILKFIEKKNDHQFDQKIFKKFNDLQTNMIGYLKAKYPRSAQNFVPGDLMKVFKPFDYVQSPENDIIRSAGFYFGSENNKQLLRNIKLFLNNIIDEVDNKFQKFQKILTEKAFNIGSKNQKNSNYKIARKLPQNTAKFINLSSNSLDIKSPQMFRVIIKWVGDMEDFLLNPESEVNQKQTFKVINLDQDKFYVDQINADDNRPILQELERYLQAQKIQYKKDLQNLLIDMYGFQHNLIKIISEGDRKQKYVPQQDAQLIKFSSYNTNFLSWMLAQKLTIVMKRLIKVGKKFKNTSFMAPLDLIKFNVTDLLRARFSGSKSQLFQVYKNLSKLEEDGQIKIIKLKNRLATPMNDVMIVFRMKDSFIICQLQLILSDAYQNLSQKLKNIQSLNHFFYELQRSPYGVVSQLSVLVGYKDSRIGYDSKINYLNSKSGINFCMQNHIQKISLIRNQFKPFACTTCSKFYGRLQNMFAMKKCELCNAYLCNVCIFKRQPNLPQIYRKQEIVNHFTKQVQVATQVNRGKKQINLVLANGKNIYEKVVNKVVIIKDIMTNQKIKKMTLTQFDSYVKLGECGSNFIYCQFQKSQLNMVSLTWNSTRNEIEFNFESVQDFYANKNMQFNQNDFIIILNTQVAIEQLSESAFEKNASINIIDKASITQKGKFKCLKLGQLYLVIGFTSSQQKKQIIVDGVSIDDYKLYYKKDFKYKSLQDYFSYLPDLQSYKTNLFLQDFGLMNKQIQQFSSLQWKNKIKQLNISKNKVTDISVVFNNIKNLNKLYASSNFISYLSIPQQLPHLTVLILNQNSIKRVQNLQKIPNITRINLRQNQLKIFPVLKLLKLRQLNLSCNYELSSNKFIQKSQFPQLAFADFANSFTNGSVQNQDLIQELTFNFPKLKLMNISTKKMSHVKFISSHLERLALDGCSLQSLKINLKSIRFLDLSRNLISSIGFLFEAQNNIIQEAIFDQNNLTSLPKIISKSLERLSVYYNKINNCQTFKQSVCSSLSSINLSHNQIQKWEPFSFPNLKQIKIQGNNIKDISLLSQSLLPRLEQLSFPSTDGINYIPILKFQNLRYLKFQKLQNCDMTDFSFSDLPNLNQLLFYNCSINVFPLLKFNKLAIFDITYGKLKDSLNLSKCQFPQLLNMTLSYIQNWNNQQIIEQGQQLKQQQKSKPKQKDNFVVGSLNFAKMRSLTISECKFQGMQNIMLSGFQNIQTIYISGAIIRKLPKIKNLNLKQFTIYASQIQEINEFTESYFPSLETLNLSNNKIQKIKILQFPNLKDLNLQQNQITQIGKLCLINLTTLNLSTNKLKKLPQILADNLVDFYFEYNDIEDVSSLAQYNTPNLKNLTLNAIQTPLLKFPTILMHKLQYLSIMDVNFQNLDSLQVSKLQNLQRLTVSNCKILSRIPVLKMINLKYLTYQLLNVNNLRNLQKSDLPQLIFLSISNIPIKSLNQLNFPKLTDISILSNAQIQDINQFCDSSLPDLKNIDFSYCQNLNISQQFNFEKLQSFTFYQCKKLQSINFLAKCENLKTINMTLGAIQRLDLTKIQNLQSLFLNDCAVSELQFSLQKQIKNLTSLNLDRNKLQTLKKMPKSEKITYVSFVGNQLSNVNQFFLSKLQNISIYLSQNKIRQIKEIRIKNIMSLNLSQNNIQNIQFLLYLQKQNENIYDIDLSKNHIKKLPKLKLNVVSLNFNNNQIQNLTSLQQSNLPKLTTLYFGNNKIKKIPKMKNLEQLAIITFQNNWIEDFSNVFQLEKQTKLYNLIYSSNLTQQKRENINNQVLKQIPTLTLTYYEYIKEEAI